MTKIRESSQRQLLGEKESQLKTLKQQWETDRTAWVQERAAREVEKMKDLERLHNEIDRLREEDGGVLQQAGEEINAGLSALKDLINTYGYGTTLSSPLQRLSNAIRMHIQIVQTKLQTYARARLEWDVARGLEEEVRSGLDERERLSRELEEARKEKDVARRMLMLRVFILFIPSGDSNLCIIQTKGRVPTSAFTYNFNGNKC